MKTLQELTLLDKFLFDQAMDDPEIYEAMLRIILGEEELKLLTPSQTEKELRTAPWLKSIRVDVFTMDENKTIYNTEMQKEYRNDLIRRSRYYQSVIDSSLLKLGEPNYNQLNDTVVIMITPFDLFGLGKYRYTFTHHCLEAPELEIMDGAKRIFLNTHGTNPDEVSPELVALLKFIEYNEVNKELDGKDKNLSKIQDKVTKIKSDEEVGVRYMQNWEEQYYLKQQGIEEGISIGREQGESIGLQKGRVEGESIGLQKGQADERNKIIVSLLSKGKSPEEIAELLGYSMKEVLSVQKDLCKN